MGNNTPVWSRRINDDGIVTVHENPWFRICSRDNYFFLEYGVPQVAILPVVDHDILLVRVKRPLICDETWELPAGGAHKGESLVAAAQRELLEETGLRINDLNRFQPMKTLSEMPNRSPELLSCFMIRLTRKEFDARGYHENEITGLRLMDAATIKQAIIAGELYLSAPIAIIARYLFEQGH